MPWIKAGLILWPESDGVPRLKRYLTDIGQPPQSIIDYILPVQGDEDLGFKTQKPIALYERLIQANQQYWRWIPFAVVAQL